MAAQRVLSQELKQKYDFLRDVLQRCLSLTDKCSETEASAILKNRLALLQSVALFVVVGEVKSGKSSFVNALLGEDVCEVAPDPCTAVIQELAYGEERSKTVLGDYWERLTLPKTVLRDITIVDTPGTNSIIRNHQTITENYIPKSDLVIFVFPAKNPHTATAWELLSLVRKDWHRKTVFVLQQADLATQRELAVNQERVKQYAHERNVQNPVLFTVSAKRELDGASDSGFAEFREYLRDAVESGEVWRMKLEGCRDTVRKIVNDLLAKLRREEAAIAEDKAFYQDLLARVEGRREKAHSLRRLVVDSLGVSYDRLASRLEEDFREGLQIGTILSRSIPYLRDKDVKTWIRETQDKFEKTAKEEIEAESSRVSKDLSDEMKAMLDDLSLAIAHRQERQQQGSHPVAADRLDILERLRSQLRDLRISDIVDEKGIQGSELGKLTLTGGGIAALGAVIAMATHLIAFDITGGILAAVGAGLVAVTLLWKRSAIMKDFSQKMDKSRDEFRGRLDQEITQIFERLFLEIQHDLKEPLALLDEETSRISSLAEEARGISEAADLL
ncbi:dynamin family protein [Syntrophus aciditrophicus]|uniref:GTPase dynamin-related n=1 Tax=Syntrophus aciditrophicus (strain SB) TaxID=56780 RepID=Q2LYB3_SYNAS|nr:dynamin family protein [Syntrophus aciditrophicus]ABC75905.1 GTPase dynamin-related [Syntrophus aciditrophicus SB]